MIAREAPGLVRRMPHDAMGWRGAMLDRAEVEAAARDTGAVAADGEPDYQRVADVLALAFGWAWRALWARVPFTGGLWLLRVEGDS